ncbi:MAG TPA: hypothetical protein VGP33_15535 [Chloroflexota bacterium]|nr:hypothetical protein [Chloroflexota bacterium]
MIPAIITVLLGAGSIAYLAWPLLGRVAASDDEEPVFDVLRERQQTAMEALRELDYERQIGKLTDAEYFPLRERYARQAMVLLKLLDQRDAARESELERAIAARRAGARPIGTPPARPRTVVSPVGTAPSRSARPWLVATGGAILAVVAAVALLVSTVNRGAVQPTVLAVVPLAAPRALAFDPSSTGMLLAGGANGTAASSDAGKTWTLLPTSGLPGGVVSFSPAPEGMGLQALTANGDRWQSNDGGRTWLAVAPGTPLPAGTQAMADVPGSPPLFVVATSDGMRASSDSGHTWSVANGFVNGLLPTKDDRDVVYAPTADQSTGPQGHVFHGLLFVATDRGLYASADGGQSWLARSLGGNLTALAVDPQNPSVLLAMDVQGQLFRSQDAGATWGR